MNEDDLQSRLSEAIVSKTVAGFAKDWLENEADTASVEQVALVRQAQATVEQISQDMMSLRAEVCGVLERAGVAVELVAGPEDEGALQYQLISLLIPAADLKRAADALETLGFIPPWPISSGRATALARYETVLQLVRHDSETTRIALKFGTARAPHPLAALRPRHADIAQADLPGWAAPGYVGVRLGRLIRERVRGVRAAVANTDFLGTPAALIDPIFDAVELTADQTLIDLGCGDGRIVIAAASRGCTAIGIESNPELVRVAQQKIRDAGMQQRARVTLGQAETADLSGVDVIFVFLPSHLTAKILPKLIAQAGHSARIVTHEQTRLPPHLSPTTSLPLVGSNALTVAHIWQSDR